MSEATLKVTYAGPLVTLQDLGRPGHMRYGVPRSGPMDRLSAAAANAALGNPAEAPLIEVSMGGLSLECRAGTLSVAVTGGEFQVTCGGQRLSSWGVFSLAQGDRLTLRPGRRGSWAYIAVAGEIGTESWLNSVSTHSTSGFGGGAVTTGQTLIVEDPRLRDDRHGGITRPDFLKLDNGIRIVLGPQERHFAKAALEVFQQESFALTAAFDRMGVRLSGPSLDLEGALSIPSEPITRGSIQVAGDGVPTVLLADHQTTGGYPKIATVLSDELDRLSQKRAGDRVRFVSTNPAEAILHARQMADCRARYLAEIAVPKGSLAQRLMRENLISGVLSGDELAP